MMYLGIFLVVCISFGLVQSRPGHIRPDDDVLKCKICLGRGENAKANCLESVVEKPCSENLLVCVQITGANVFQLLCASQSEFNNFKASCDYDNSCVVVQV